MMQEMNGTCLVESSQFGAFKFGNSDYSLSYVLNRLHGSAEFVNLLEDLSELKVGFLDFELVDFWLFKIFN
jgi:hypothetical protein